MNPTQHRSVRVPDDTWAAFGTSTEPHGGRASVLRRLMALYLTDRALRTRVAALPDDLARDAATVTAHHQ